MTVAEPIFFLSSVTSRKCFINRERFNKIGILPENIKHCDETSLYLSKLCLTKISSGHKPFCNNRRHCRSDSEFTGFIAGSCHNTPLPAPAYCNRLSPQFRIDQAAQLMQKTHPYLYVLSFSQNIKLGVTKVWSA